MTKKCAPCRSPDWASPRKRTRQRRFVIEPILKDEIVCDELPLIKYCAVVVADVKHIGALVRELPPLPPEMNHLKRANNRTILVGPETIQIDEALRIIDGLLFNADVILISAPARKPLTRRQFEWAKQFWPTKFHPNGEYEALLSGTFFDDKEHEIVVKHYLQTEQLGDGEPGCLIVDSNDAVVATGSAQPSLLGHAAMEAVTMLCEKHRVGKSDVLQYLGTGFDVYLTEEPCAMCAMALVHFRVRRVFYGKRTPKGGVYESSWRIQEERQLNHHYQVFRVTEVI